MSRRYRIILFSLTLVLLGLIGWFIEGSFYSLLDSFWFTSGFLLLILLSLVDQPFFSKDSNIFVNAITAGVSLLLVPVENRNSVFILFLSFVIYLGISSYALMLLRKNELKEENKIVQFLSRLNRIIGKPEVIFSAFFLWGALIQYTYDVAKFNALLIFWAIFILLNIPELAVVIEKIFMKKEKNNQGNVGTIFGVQSQNTFLVKLIPSCKDLDIFRFVEFKYSVDDKVRKGLICEMMFLDQEQWIKVITNSEIDTLFGQKNHMKNHINDFVYLIEEAPVCNFIEKFVGIVREGSTIRKVKFFYNSKVEIAEGTMLETTINGTKVLYQIVEGLIYTELLSNKNQSGYIIGEAVQLGTWDNRSLQFNKLGWLPEINTPIYLASEIEKVKKNKDEVTIGYLPRTNYPVVINKEVAITHHMAIIGLTGTGKSVLSRHIIREYIKDEDVKVICIDFTGEYSTRFIDLDPRIIIDDTRTQAILADIDWIDKEEGKFSNQRNHNELKEKKKNIDKLITESITEFLQSDKEISIFELPEVENTSGVMVYTQCLFRALFKVAKVNKSYGKRVCLVLEEAHTIIPEWNSAGISEKKSQPLINSIAQIALQGRKYNIGLLVIAQRTANVSKTILTQCNSIISFQAYDKTSTEFLSNYFGQDIALALSKLEFRQAVASGKAFRSNVPMIFEVPEINEEDYSQDIDEEELNIDSNQEKLVEIIEVSAT